jgi:hypothetical protein
VFMWIAASSACRDSSIEPSDCWPWAVGKENGPNPCRAMDRT